MSLGGRHVRHWAQDDPRAAVSAPGSPLAVVNSTVPTSQGTSHVRGVEFTTRTLAAQLAPDVSGCSVVGIKHNRYPVAVHVILTDTNSRVLLMRRAGSGYAAGLLGLPAG